MRPTINNLRGDKATKKDNTVDNTPEHTRALRNQIKEVDEDVANVEAEAGETVISPGMGFYTIGGDKHYDGGTPLLLPEGAFVFSDSKDSKITGDILKMFNKNPDKNFTPAELSKQYKLNKYLAILKDPDSDYHDKTTAQLMIDNNTNKLSEIAFLQEGNKGFPEGTPSIDSVVETFMKKGGSFDGGGPWKGDRTGPRASQKKRGLKRGFNKFSAPWLEDFGYENSYTGFSSALKDLGYTGNDDIKAMQKYLVEQNYKQGNFDLFNSFYKDYGATNQGTKKGIKDDARPVNAQYSLDDLTADLSDGLLGIRTGNMAQALLKYPKVGDVWKKYATDIPGPVAPDEVSVAQAPNTGSQQPAPPINGGQAPSGNTSQDQPMKLGFNTLQVMDMGNTLFDAATVRKGRPTRYQNYGLEQAAGLAANVRPYDYQAILNEVSKQATNAYRANSLLSNTAASRAAANAAVYGQALEQATKVQQDEYNQNANLYNQNQQQLAQYAAMIGDDKMKNAMTYNDRVEVMNANYDNEVKFLKNQALSKLNQYAAYNQALLYDNMLHPQFTFDPGKGFAGTMSFNPRKDPFGTGGASSTQGGGGSSLQGMVDYIQSNFDVKDKGKALELAMQALRSNQTYDDAALGSNSFTNPMLRYYNGTKSR